jgi:hypothetical protein
MTNVPPAAAQSISRIEALLDEAEGLLARGGATDEAAYALRETRTRYLPDTLRAYFEIPPSLRGERDASGRTPDELLLVQLDHLERAAAQRLRELAARGTDGIAANGAFLTERFGPAEALPPAAPVDAGISPPVALVRAFLEGIGRDAGRDPGTLVALAAERFAAIAPQLVSVQRARFGLGAVEALALDVPVREGVLRYGLASRRGGIEATATKVVRGVALRTESVDLDEWLRGLYEDLGAYVDRDRRTRDTLSRFLEH